MYCNQFYLKFHKLCLLLCWKINSETDLCTLDSIFRQKAGPLSAPSQQNLSACLNARPRLCNGHCHHCHHCHYFTECCGFKFFRANSKACILLADVENCGMEFVLRGCRRGLFGDHHEVHYLQVIARSRPGEEFQNS